MSFLELQAFCKVYEHQSLSAAARALHVDPSVISRRLKGLESRLGVALFLRSTRQVSATNEAEALYGRVAPALEAIAEAELAAQTEGQVLRGPLRVAAPGALGRRRVAPALHRFCHEHPEVEVQLLLSDRRIDLIREKVDIAVRPGRPGAVGQVVRRLGTSAQWLVASPSYLVSAPPFSAEAESFAQHRVVSREQGGLLIDARLGLPPNIAETLTVAFTTDDLGATADAALAGLGVAVLPSWRVATEVAEGRLVRLPFRPEGLESPIFAVLPAGRQITIRARALLEALVRAFKEPEGAG